MYFEKKIDKVALKDYNHSKEFYNIYDKVNKIPNELNKLSNSILKYHVILFRKLKKNLKKIIFLKMKKSKS